MSQLHFITPDWPAPDHVRAVTTLRKGGASRGVYESLNLGSHVGDEPTAVRENRARLRRALGLPAEPLWLNQVHGSTVFDSRAQAWAAGPLGAGLCPDEDLFSRLAAQNPASSSMERPPPPSADASVAFAPGIVCVVLTADCLPVLICDRVGTRVAAVHAGWRGLASGVIGAAIASLEVQPADLLAWLGPAIEPEAFEVGAEVREQFLRIDADNAAAFSENTRGRWQADLYRLARFELRRLGVPAVYGGGYRGFTDAKRFFSYRRDGQTGRMGTMIWLAR